MHGCILNVHLRNIKIVYNLGLITNCHLITLRTSMKSPYEYKTVAGGWSTWISCIAVHMMLPLVPLGLEKFIEGHLSEKSIAITAAMYAIALAISSRWMWYVFIGFSLSVIYSGMFGFITREGMLDATMRQSVDTKGLWAIGFLFLLHLTERFHRHVMLREPFFEFINR